MPDNFGNFFHIKNDAREPAENSPMKAVVLFGTRPEAIKLAPVIFELKKRGLQTIVVSSSQHTELLAPFTRIFNIKNDYDLRVMRENQTPTEVCVRILSAFEQILEAENPDVVIVQGDTTTAFAGALTAFNRKVKIAHLEAGLRSGNSKSPFPEEMYRRLISQIADFHFAATANNKENLLAENIERQRIFVCGNTVVDALRFILERSDPSVKIKNLVGETSRFRRILLTTHRRESFGETLSENLRVLRRFVEKHKDVCLFFPAHPNPNVRAATNRILANRERIFLLEPLDYIDFVYLMRNAWLIISDSGGVQEEAPSLGKPVFILRENTERPEAIAAGAAKLVGANSLTTMLETNYKDETWITSVKSIVNPFGDGKAASRIVEILEAELSARSRLREETFPPQTVRDSRKFSDLFAYGQL